MCSLWWNDVGFFWILTLHWYHYLMSNLNQEGFYGGSMVITISKIEVVNFLGVILKMSNDNWWLDRYVSYFQAQNIIHCSPAEFCKLTQYYEWAREKFSLNCFNQIQAAMHPKLSHTENNNKFHQCRHELHQVNTSAEDCFILSFDKGGVPFHSNFCPIHQYGKDKPNNIDVRYSYHAMIFLCTSIKDGYNQVLVCQ